MERRRFLRNGGLLGTVIGAFGAGNVIAGREPHTMIVDDIPTTPVKEDISKFAPPDEAHTLQINGSYLADEEKAKQNDLYAFQNSPYVFHSQPKQTHSVSMTVGKDNRLWMKVGDSWHRVALES